jgi:Xaa-Pro aminopeptidase
MSGGLLPSVIPRLVRARTSLRALSIDALVVSHLPNIRYLTGFTGTAGLLVLTATHCILIVDFRYQSAARALIASHPELAPYLQLVIPAHSYDETLADVLREAGARRIGIEGAYMPVARFNKLSSSLAAAAPTPLRSPDACPALVPTERAIESARVVKDAGEVNLLRTAGRLIASASGTAAAFARPGRTELDVAADIDALLRKVGFERPAFETIVASGPNGALPHARPGRRVLREGDGVVLDFGGVYDGYCVDLTRTVQLGETGPRFRQMFAAVTEAQQAAIAAVRPGVMASTVDRAARDVLGRYGLEHAFGHGTGHGLGLEVHEEPRVGKLTVGQPDVPLEPGMVFTIEPGAYLEEVGGVRIEDDVLVTDEGCEVLTADRV